MLALIVGSGLAVLGHITISPPSAMITPPCQTQTTSGLKFTRISALLATTPASTR